MFFRVYSSSMKLVFYINWIEKKLRLLFRSQCLWRVCWEWWYIIFFISGPKNRPIEATNEWRSSWLWSFYRYWKKGIFLQDDIPEKVQSNSNGLLNKKLRYRSKKREEQSLFHNFCWICITIHLSCLNKRWLS